MKEFTDVKHRLEVLEKPMIGIDPLEIILDALSDNELGLVGEYRELHKAGFSVEEAREMMGAESYDMAIATIQKVDEELQRLTMPRPRTEMKKQKRNKKAAKELGFDACDE